MLKFFTFIVTFLCLISVIGCFDYIIIGGGAAGCSLAAELSKKGFTLLIERGLSDTQVPDSQSLAGWPDILTNISNNNGATDDIQTTEGVWFITPQILGGGSSLNGGAWIRENEDYFSGFGVTLNYNDVLRSYEAVEERLNIQQQASPRTNVGTDLNTAFTSSGGFNSGGLSLTRVVNSTQFTYSTFAPNPPRVRHSAARLLDMNNSQLVVLTQTVVNRILFNNAQPPKAIGVDVSNLQRPGSYQINLNARGKLFLSAGAVHSPVIALRSGVAPSSLNLASFGITRIATNNNVGVGFVDKPGVSVAVLMATPPPVPETTLEIVVNSPTYFFLETSGGDIVTDLAAVSAAIAPPPYRTQATRLALQELFALLGPQVDGFLNAAFEAVSILPTPLSRGSVTLQSVGGSIVPSITAGYFSDTYGADFAQMIQNLILTYYVLQDPAVATLVGSVAEIEATIKYLNDTIFPINPEGASILSSIGITGNIATLPPLFNPTSALSIAEFIETYYVATWHGAGSMSQAVDANFNLLGVSNLQVVDASVLQHAPRTEPQATIIMLGNYVGKRTPACTTCKVNCGYGGIWDVATKQCVCRPLWKMPSNCAGSAFCPCNCFLTAC